MVGTVPREVAAWCAENGWGEVRVSESLTGGDVSQTSRLAARDGRRLILKQNIGAPPDMFACEAEGLAALSVTGGPRLPAIFLIGSGFLLLEDLRPVPPRDGYWKEFGEQLAILHRTPSTRYGFAHDNYCGPTRQANTWTEDGHEFFWSQRLCPQAQAAREAGWLEEADIRRLEAIHVRLRDLVPPQSPALIHGDLWSGNALCGPNGEPALVDPAAHWGWAEAELGMTTLFGGFPRAFYDAYASHYPLAPGWRDRLDLYNLYHLLNHLNIFGVRYLARVQAILRRYA